MAARCAIYCRLSKEDCGKPKSDESESIQNQRELLEKYAADMGWEVAGVYSDDDASGADDTRPQFGRLLEDARLRKFDIILCKTQSRFTRDIGLVEKYLHTLFPLWGVRFVAVVDRSDTYDRGNKKARQLNGLINEWYLEDLSDNVKAVLDHKRREGKFIGSFAPYGYMKSAEDKNRLVVDAEAAEVVKNIFAMYGRGMSEREIARKLTREGIPNPSEYKRGKGIKFVSAGKPGWNKNTVGRILENEVYIGDMVQGKRRKLSYKSKVLTDVPPNEWIRARGTHEPIIDPDTFESASLLKKAGRKL